MPDNQQEIVNNHLAGNDGLFNPGNEPVDPMVALYQQWQANGGKGMSPYLTDALKSNPNLLPSASDITINQGEGKYGLPVITGKYAQYPLAAQAIQRFQPLQQQFATAKMMADVVKQIRNAPQGSPQHESGLIDGWNKDVVNGVYADGEKRFGSNETARLLSTGVPQTQAQAEYLDDAMGTIQYYDQFANIDKNVGERIDKMRAAKTLPDEDYAANVMKYNSIFLDPYKSIDQKVREERDLYGKITEHEAVDKIVEKYVPKDFKYGENTVIQKSVDKDGKPIAGSFSEITIVNQDGSTTNITDKVNQNAAETAQELLATGSHKYAPDLVEKYQNDPTDKNKQAALDAITPQVRDYITGKMEQSSKVVLKRERNINIKSPKETPLTTGADKFNDWNSEKFMGSDQTVKGANYPATVQKYFNPPKKSKSDSGAVVFDSKIPAEALSKVESSPAWGTSVLSHSLDVDGNSFANTDAYNDIATKKTTIGDDGKPLDPTQYVSNPEPVINLDGISMVYGTNADPEKGFQPTTVLKDINKTGKQLNEEGYAPYYRMKYVVNYYDNKGVKQKKELYHYVDSREDGATRSLDDFFLSKSTAQDIEKLTQ
jgi:hypothetical protein